MMHLRHLLIHAYGADTGTVTSALRVARNSSHELGPDVGIHIVVQGPLVAELTAGRNVEADLRDAIGHDQIEVLACRNSMASAGVSADDLQPGVTTVPSAVAFLAEQQFNGWAYVRI